LRNRQAVKGAALLGLSPDAAQQISYPINLIDP
jgi:hypothetical protein